MEQYPVTTRLRQHMREEGIVFAEQDSDPIYLMVSALEAYEHGNAEIETVGLNITLDDYAAVLLDLAHVISSQR